MEAALKTLWTCLLLLLTAFPVMAQDPTPDWNVAFYAPMLPGIPNGGVRPPPQRQLGLGPAYYAANDNAQNSAFIFLKQGFVRLKSGHSSVRFGGLNSQMK
jgi:hypothetical protein